MQEEALKNEVSDNESIKNEQYPKEFIPENIREFIGEEEETSNHPENDVPPLSEDAEEILPHGATQNNISLGTPINSVNKNSNALGREIERR